MKAKWLVIGGVTLGVSSTVASSLFGYFLGKKQERKLLGKTIVGNVVVNTTKDEGQYLSFEMTDIPEKFVEGDTLTFNIKFRDILKEKENE